MASLPAVKAALKMLGRVFSGDITTEKAQMYVAALEDLTDEQVAASVAVLVKTHTGQFLPVPAQMREACGANKAPAIDISRLLRLIDREGTYINGWCHPRVETVRAKFGDAVGDAYAEVGGPSRLFSTNDTTREIAEREFGQALAETPGTVIRLPEGVEPRQLHA